MAVTKFVKYFDATYGPGASWDDTDPDFFKLIVPSAEHNISGPGFAIQVHKKFGSSYEVMDVEKAESSDVSFDVEIDVKKPSGTFEGRILILG